MYGISVLFSCRVVSIRSVRSYSSRSTKKLLEFLADMPKASSARIAEAQRQRQQISKKSDKYGPSTVYLQVLGSGAKGAPNTLYLFTDQKRYLFNCGECTQRLAHEHKVKLSRLDHIFITSKTWRNIGGLPGLSLTLQDVGVPNITLHGPDGLDELYNATRRFVIMKDMQVTMAHCSPSEDFEDNVMNVKYVLLGPNENILTGKELKSTAKKPKLDSNSEKQYEEFIHDETDYYKPEVRNMELQNNKKYNKEKEKPKLKANAEKDTMKKKTEKVLHELQKKTNCSVAYICTLKKRLGTLDLAKCVERGVKPGPMLGQLKAGQDVVLEDGTIVLSKDVKTPDDPGPVFIVIDVPELSYLKESEFSAHFYNEKNPPENVPTLIVHFTPPEVFHHPTYRAFMALFGPCTRHLILNAQNSCLGSEAVHRTQHKLHLLDPDIFPLLRDVSVPAVWNVHPPVPKTNSPIRLKGLEELKNKIALAQFQNIINLEGSAKGDGHPPTVEESDSVTKLELLAGRTLTMYHLRPKRQLDRSAEPKLHIQDYIQETMDVDGFVGSLEQFRRLVDSIRYAKSDSKEYPKVLFLGTGSCIPSKTRNTSAIVVHIDEDHSMLLDCGEGTFGQLVRFYGPKKVNSFLRTLKAIYISHLHADHHIGLIGVLQARRSAIEEAEETPVPVYLLAPGQIVTWLTLYDQQFERLKSDYTLIPNQSLLHDQKQANTEVTSAVLAAIGIQDIKTCLVAHCPNAFGVALEVDERHKITYSGDTLPCEELVKIGESSTLLIHEATMEDELADEARVKMHSTTTQAIDIGRQMQARYTVLTHFSQRYARLPRLNAHILNDNNSVGIAFDNMQITMSDLELLPHMYAPLQLMFAEHCVEMELKAAQRQRIRDRRGSSPNLSPGSCQRSLTRIRRVTPCSAAASLPVPRARYRESNASRLRQENKGMTVSGTVGRPRSRSNSSSASPGSRKSPVGSVSRQRSGVRSVKSKPDDATKESEKDNEKIIDIATTPRSISDASNFSRGTINSGSHKISNTSSNIVDTRSKTLNAAPPTGEEVMDLMCNNTKKRVVAVSRPKTINASPPSGEEVMDLMSNTTKKHCVAACPVGIPGNKGYGKPLVTPMNKKLTIRRDSVCKPPPLHCAVELPVKDNRHLEKCQASLCITTKPARSWKAENRESTSSNAPLRPEMNRTKIPTKVTVSGNKLRASNTSPNVFPDTKIPIMRNNSGGGSLRGSVSTVTRLSNKTPKRPSKVLESKEDVSKIKIKSIHDARDAKKSQNIRSITPEMNKSPPRLPNRSQSPAPKRFAHSTEPTKKPSTPPNASAASHAVSDQLKQSFNKDAPAAPLHSSSTAHSRRSFKPQLEDIKSSFLLLNKKANKFKTCATPVNYMSHIPRPLSFNDEIRRQQLIEIKQKFKSKGFWNDSKYDKIEGLNWITWK